MAEGQIAIIRSVGGLVFDATFEEQHDSDLEVTDNPVETGVLVSDHAFMKPLRCKIRAGVSDIVLTERESDPFAQGVSRHREAYRLLCELQAKAEPFDVQTGLRLYKSMVCTAVRTTQNKDNPEALIFDADLREVIIVSTQSVLYPPRKDKKTKEQADKKTEKGEQQGKEVGKDKPRDKSILKGLVGSAKGGGG